MAEAIYDSGWVPAASGAIRASVDLSPWSAAHLILAASGTNGATGSACYWYAGGTTPVPWTKSTPAYPTSPRVSGTYTVANPAANAFTEYFFGGSTTGTAQLDPFPPMELGVNLTAGSASWARVIVEAR